MNILIHATLYPEYADGKRPNTTLFIHYYAAEWIKQGHNVLVIHHKAVFPRAVVAACGLYAKLPLPLAGRVRDYLDGYGVDGDAEYLRDGVPVCRRSIVKPLPRMLFSRRAIRKRAAECEKILQERNFRPDVVVADFINPGLFVAREMGGAPCVVALHDTDMGYLDRLHTKKTTERALRDAAVIAFRSGQKEEYFKDKYFIPEKSLQMPSGLPADFPVEPRVRSRVRDFLCAGRMVPLKRMDTLIRAFGMLKQPDITLTLVGEGVEEENLRMLAQAQPNADKIRFAGRLPREKTLQAMRDADCFALVSESESFGMTYVEALYTGAAVIGAPGQGGTAFIREGDTGYLIPSDDAQGLAQRMQSLIDMEEADVSALSKRAAESVAHLRDDRLAAAAAEYFMELAKEK